VLRPASRSLDDRRKRTPGRRAIRASYAALLSANVVRKAEISNAAHPTAGAWGAGWGNFSFTLAPKSGGAPITIKSRFTEVVEKKDGRWRCLVDHASADPAVAAAK
jgi:ketosteroid isomerase-like protein